MGLQRASLCNNQVLPFKWAIKSFRLDSWVCRSSLSVLIIIRLSIILEAWKRSTSRQVSGKKLGVAVVNDDSLGG